MIILVNIQTYPTKQLLNILFYMFENINFVKKLLETGENFFAKLNLKNFEANHVLVMHENYRVQKVDGWKT